MEFVEDDEYLEHGGAPCIRCEHYYEVLYNTEDCEDPLCKECMIGQWELHQEELREAEEYDD